MSKVDGKSPHVMLWVAATVPLIFALAALAYQANTSIRLSRYQNIESFIATDNNGASSHVITVNVAYPRVLLLEEVPGLGRPVQVWLSAQRPSSVPGTYTVSLGPPTDEVMFTDRNGTPVMPSVEIGVTEPPTDSGSWFLRRAPSVANSIDGSQPTSFELRPTIVTPTGSQMDVDPDSFLVRLETAREARLRQICDRVFGPATPLIGILASLTVFFWNYNNRQRELERESLKLQQERDRRISDLSSIWNTDQTLAVRRYLEVKAETQKDTDKDALKRLDWLWDNGWKKRVEDVAIASLARGDFGFAHELHKELCLEESKATSSGGVETSPSPISNAGLDSENDKPKQACDILKLIPGASPAPEAKVRALVTLAASRGGLLEESLVMTLAQTFSNVLTEKGVMAQAVRYLDEERAAQWLVSTPQVRQQCRRVADSEPKGSPDHQASNQLLRLDYARIDWQSRWQTPRALKPPEKGIGEAVAARGWADNPFGPDRVEDEPRSLDGLWVKPPIWDALNAPGPVILQSGSGYGQSFALRYLLWWHMEQWSKDRDGSSTTGPRLFPALLNHEALLQARTRRESVSEMAFGIGQALIHFLALNPSLFDQSTLTERLAVARLCLACEFRLGNLREYLRHYLNQHDQPDSLVPDWLTHTMRETAAAAQPVSLANPIDVLATLAEARLARSKGFIVAVDISARGLWLPRVRILVDLISDLMLSGIDLKLGLPANSELRTQKIPTVRLVSIEAWPSERLEALLRKRLEHAEGFAHLANPDVESLEEWVVNEAAGSPQRLVQLGNRLLAVYGSRPTQDQLSPKDLVEVASRVESADGGTNLTNSQL